MMREKKVRLEKVAVVKAVWRLSVAAGIHISGIIHLFFFAFVENNMIINDVCQFLSILFLKEKTFI